MPASTAHLDTVAAIRPAVVWPRQRLIAVVAFTVALLATAGALFGGFARPAGAAEIAAPRGQVVQYTYRDGDALVFLDPTTYEQVAVSDVQVGAAIGYIVEGTQVVLLRHDDGTVTVDLPATVQLRVADLAPGQRDPAARAAVLETGLAVQVPLSARIGDVVTVDTSTGQIVGRP